MKILEKQEFQKDMVVDYPGKRLKRKKSGNKELRLKIQKTL
jgi:hypothetical protein